MYIRPNLDEIDQPVEGDQAYQMATLVTETQAVTDSAKLPDAHKEVRTNVVLGKYSQQN